MRQSGISGQVFHSPEPNIRSRVCFDLPLEVNYDEFLRHRIDPEDAAGRLVSHRCHKRQVEVNDAACRQYGYTRSELLQMTPMDIDAPEGLSAIPDVMQNLVTKGSAVWEGMHLSTEGRKIPVEISNVSFSLHGDQMILSVARDLTEQKRAEGAIRETKNRLNAILQASPEAIYLINPQGIVTMWNKAAEQMFGWSEEEAVGNVLPIVQEDKRTRGLWRLKGRP